MTLPLVTDVSCGMPEKNFGYHILTIIIIIGALLLMLTGSESHPEI